MAGFVSPLLDPLPAIYIRRVRDSEFVIHGIFGHDGLRPRAQGTIYNLQAGSSVFRSDPLVAASRFCHKEAVDD
jgi:hypothetical protein